MNGIDVYGSTNPQPASQDSVNLIDCILRITLNMLKNLIEEDKVKSFIWKTQIQNILFRIGCVHHYRRRYSEHLTQ